eukprot:5954722-Prymnesium_polylepis.1
MPTTWAGLHLGWQVQEPRGPRRAAGPHARVLAPLSRCDSNLTVPVSTLGGRARVAQRDLTLLPPRIFAHLVGVACGVLNSRWDARW